ncbi:MAG TPA: 5'/3'-nucleotidase SurE [Thermoanaerobaculia bacterium]|nr:5'/3'-nucleotidase SurE [Thermoanaerobaculia bacterium]
MAPRILVTNDDGIYSEGLRKLAEALGTLGEVTIVAPDREQSAASHALTLNRPLRLLQIEEHEWIVDGTPTDCVNLAVLYLLKERRPDIICSGINFGPNLGDDVTYSGTISAAFEGSLLQIPSIAFSALVGEHFSFERSAELAARLVAEVLERPRDARIILNVNFPVEPIRGIRVTRLGKRVYSEGVIERLDPRGRKYFWIGGEPPVWTRDQGTDFEAVEQGYVSITPLHLDLTHHESLENLRSLEQKFAISAE